MLNQTRLVFLVVIISLVWSSSCNSSTDKHAVTTDSVADAAKIHGEERLATDNTATQIGDTVFANQKIYISVLPSDNFLDSIKTTVSEDEWSEVVFDNEFYRDAVASYLKKKGYVHVVTNPSQRWRFILSDGSSQLVDPNDFYGNWGNFIFNGKDPAFLYEGSVDDIASKLK